MRVISLLFHDVYESDPVESGFVSDAAHRYKLSMAGFDAQLAHIARVRRDAPLAGETMSPVLSPAAPTDRPLGAGRAAGGHANGAVADLHGPPEADDRTHPYTITFDDGGVSYHTVIADRLEARGWRGHCFVSTEFIGRRGFLDAAQLRELDARGHVIGSHSASHPARFSALPFDAMVREWRDSRNRLEDLLGHAVHVASVPGGYFSAAVARAAAEAGVTRLFTSEPTTAVGAGTPALFGRFTIRQGDPPDAAMRFLAAAPWARSSAWLSWNAKGLVKPLLGPAYGHVADWVCALRRPPHSAGAAARVSATPGQVAGRQTLPPAPRSRARMDRIDHPFGSEAPPR